MKFIRALSCAALAASLLLAVSCASSKKESVRVPPVTPEDCDPMAVIKFTVNGELKFFYYRDMSSSSSAGSAASSAVGGGLLGKLAGSLASAAVSKAEESARPFLKTDALVSDFHVQQVVMEGLAEFPEVLNLLTAEDVTGTRAYASIKGLESDYIKSVGGFRNLHGAKDVEAAKSALEKAHGAKGFATVDVEFGYYLDEKESKLDKALGVMNRISGEAKSQSESGYLYPSVTVNVYISDRNGRNLPQKEYLNGSVTGRDYKRYVGVAVGQESVPISRGKYNGEEFYALYTEDLVREAIKNAALRP